MPVISNTLLNVTLPSGNHAVYDVQPQHLPRDHIPESVMWPIEFGTQVAHELKGRWYKPGGWEEITDLRTIALLERAAEHVAQAPAAPEQSSAEPAQHARVVRRPF